jgi:hypothetical protein
MVLRIGERMVGLAAAFRLWMWMGGIERGRRPWALLSSIPVTAPQSLAKCQSSACLRSGPIRLEPPASYRYRATPSDPVRPLVRVLNPGPFLDYFSRSPLPPSIGTAVGTIFRVALSPLRRSRGNVARLNFDPRVDPLWALRRPDGAMSVRDHRYLNGDTVSATTQGTHCTYRARLGAGGIFGGSEASAKASKTSRLLMRSIGSQIPLGLTQCLGRLVEDMGKIERTVLSADRAVTYFVVASIPSLSEPERNPFRSTATKRKPICLNSRSMISRVEASSSRPSSEVSTSSRATSPW